MIKNKILKKYFIVLPLVGALVFAPVCSANAKSYHRGDSLVAAAVGGAMIGLVGAAVHNILRPTETVVVEEPVYVEQEPVVIHKTVVLHEPYHHKPMRVARYVRHHRRHY